jgi:HAD superfamily hydrolase (TIGR01490 family)
MKKRIYAFDFDGTLTTRDTLIAFIRYAKGTGAFVLGFLRHAHLLVLMKLGLYPNWKAKQKVFSYFFKGMSLGDFDTLCQRFAADNRQLLRPEGIRTLEQAGEEGADIVIVSASIDNWVKPFFTNLDGLADNLPKITVLGTQIEIADRKLTGRFLTKNCYGQEKVNRILALYPNRSEYTLTAYGDSRGDKELLVFADEAHYKPFR